MFHKNPQPSNSGEVGLKYWSNGSHVMDGSSSSSLYLIYMQRLMLFRDTAGDITSSDLLRTRQKEGGSRSKIEWTIGQESPISLFSGLLCGPSMRFISCYVRLSYSVHNSLHDRKSFRVYLEAERERKTDSRFDTLEHVSGLAWSAASPKFQNYEAKNTCR